MSPTLLVALPLMFQTSKTFHDAATNLTQPSPSTPWYRHRGHVARHGLLPHPFLPSVSNGEADWPVLHSSTAFRRSCRAGLGRIPKDGRRPRLRRISVDVPGLGCHNNRRRHPPPLVASRPADNSRRTTREEEIPTMVPAQPPCADRPGR